MLDPKRQAEFDQGVEAMGEVFPAMWCKLFEKCKEEGFTEQQAFDLVKTYILSQNPNGIKGAKGVIKRYASPLHHPQAYTQHGYVGWK